MKKRIALGLIATIAIAVWANLASAGNVVKIITEGSPPKYQDTKYTATLKEYNYDAVIAGGGFSKPIDGNVGELSIQGINLVLKEKKFKSGAIETEQLGKVQILFSDSLVKEGFIVLLTDEQLKKLEKLVVKGKKK